MNFLVPDSLPRDRELVPGQVLFNYRDAAREENTKTGQGEI